MKKKNPSIDESYYYLDPRERTKHNFYFRKNPNEYKDPRMMYSDLKNVLSYLDKIKDSDDKRGIRKALDLITDLTQKGVGERVGRISDYGNIRSDLYKIAEYLSESKYGSNKSSEDFFELAMENKKSLLDKINFREKQLNGEIPRFDWMNPNNFNLINKFSQALVFLGFSFALLFLFPTTFSGAVIAESELKKNSLVGIISLLLGLVSFLFLFKFRKHK